VRQDEERRPSFDEVFVHLMGQADDRPPG
jgi:hypothetical protein